MTHDGKIATVLLDSGAIGRNFITASYCKLNKFELRKLPYPIKIISIHGNETSDTGIELHDLEVNALGQKAIIPKIQLILLKEGPADIIIGLRLFVITIYLVS